MRLVAMLPALFALSLAAADEPASPASTAAQSSSAPAAESSAPAASSAGAASNAAPASSALSANHQPAATNDKAQALAVDDKRLISEGYKMTYINGQKVFCRREPVLGSNIERKVCGTADQLAQSRQDSRDLVDRMQRNQLNPAGH
ncbi:MAG TPA: hypothetical protein VMG11_05500 [Steroidobacteraceae bacterium]|nr:hypothetical protein [Steroidobacteraceae bacterium]